MKCFLRRMRENSHTERVGEGHDLGRAAILHKLVSASATDVFSSSSSRVLPQARRASRIVPLRLVATGLLVATAGFMVTALGALPSWVRNIEAGSAIEAVFFRAMSLPGGTVQFRRPPSETRPALGDLIKAQPKNADLLFVTCARGRTATRFHCGRVRLEDVCRKCLVQRCRPVRIGRVLSPASSAPR